MGERWLHSEVDRLNGSEWKISLERLQLKCGSASTLKEFRRLIGQIVEEDQLHQHIPDYSIEMDDGEMIVFRSPGTAGIVPAKFDDARIGYLNAMTFEAAKEACPGWDNYYLERERLEWMTEEPRNRDAAFIGLFRKWFERRGTLR